MWGFPEQEYREGGFQGLLEAFFKFKCTMDLYKTAIQKASEQN